MESFIQKLQVKYLEYVEFEDLEMMTEIRCMIEACLCEDIEPHWYTTVFTDGKEVWYINGVEQPPKVLNKMKPNYSICDIDRDPIDIKKSMKYVITTLRQMWDDPYIDPHSQHKLHDIEGKVRAYIRILFERS